MRRWSRRFACGALLTVHCGAAQMHAAEYVVAAGIEADTEDSLALSVTGSLGVSDNTWLSATAAQNRSDAGVRDLRTGYFDAGVDHWFGPLGVRVGVAYWGDADLLDSVDGRASVYWKNETLSIALDYERRAFDLTLGSGILRDPRSVEFQANGVGASLRLQASERVSLYARGMDYAYSRDIAIEPNVDVLRVFALSRLSLINSLLDHRLSGGIEVDFGARTLDFRVATLRTAVFRDRVNTFGIGFLTPLGNTSDIEFRLASDDADSFGRATVFSVFLYFYGG